MSPGIPSLALGLHGTRTLASQVRALFANGEQGAIYGTDFSTLFQDAGPTNPVTAVEQQVGYRLDMSGRGNHLVQATATKRAYVSRRVNLLTASEFPNGVTDAPLRNGVTAATMTGYAGALEFTASGNYAFKSVTTVAGQAYRISCVVQMQDGLPPVFPSSTPAAAAKSFAFVLGGGTVDLSDAQVTDLGGGMYRMSKTAVAAAGNSNFGVSTYAGQIGRTFKVTAYSCTLAIDSHLPYQRVNTATDYDDDPSKFPTYLKYELDDSYQTINNVDFTGTDKMTVWAGITKLSDAAAGMVLEFSPAMPSNAGSFSLIVGGGGGTEAYGFGSQGTIGRYATQLKPTNSAPASNVVGGVGDIGGDIVTLLVNGVQAGQSTADQGTGNYGNYPLFVGARNNSSLFFNGRDYGLIIRGAQSSPHQLDVGNRYLKQQMRLP